MATVAASGIATSLAGCSGSSGGADTPDFEVNKDAPARLALLTGTPPEEGVALKDEFTITAVVANTGGETLDTEADVEMFHPSSGVDPLNSTIVVDGLNSGDTKEVTVGPFEPAFAGKWEFRGGNGFASTHDKFDLAVDVSSKEFTLGESFDHPSGLRFTPEEFSIERAFHYIKAESAGLLYSNEVKALQSPASKQVIARVSMTVENRTSKPMTTEEKVYTDNKNPLSQTSVDFNHGSRYPPMNSTFEGSHIDNLELDAGDSGTYYILSAVDIENLSDLSLNVAFTDDDSAPEIVTQLDPQTDLPKFEFVELDLPDERKTGNQELGVVVKNTGDSAGTFRGAIQWKSDDEWFHLEPALKAEIEPGETATTAATSDVDPEDAPYEYRVVPFSERFSF
jgi:hypothetical protein